MAIKLGVAINQIVWFVLQTIAALLGFFVVALQPSQAAASDGGKRLVDVTDGQLYDGWGNAAVRTLSIYYEGSGSGPIQMLGYRASFLPAFDWANGTIASDASSDLYGFYASGAGASRTQYTQDPAYAFNYVTRYPEPLGRVDQAYGAGYVLGSGASQSRTVTSDYQNWSDAGLGTASGIDTAGLENDFNTSSSSGGIGPTLTTYGQTVRDVAGLTGLSRQAWTADGATQGAVWSAQLAAFNANLPASLTPPTGVTGEMSAIAQKLRSNYFDATVSEASQFVATKVATDVLGQWGFAYDPNLEGSAHLFRDDAGRVRLLRANPDLTDTTSQGFRYVKYDQWSRVIETGILLDVAKSSFADYASWARQADLDRQLTGANSCAVFTISYDADPVTGELEAYDERRGALSARSYYPTAIEDQPTACPGRGLSDPVNQSLYSYDDLGRTLSLSEHRRGETSEVYRTTARSWPEDGLLAQMVFPDADQAQAFVSTGQGSVTSWPDILGRSLRLCQGTDCSGVVYSDITSFDWMSLPLSVVAGNGVGDAYAYDFRGKALSQSSSLEDTVLFAESLRDMQIADEENPCSGSTGSPDYTAGMLIARKLAGDGLPTDDQNSWDCYAYDGAMRLTQTDS